MPPKSPVPGKDAAGGVFTVRIQPRAAKNEIVPAPDGGIKIRLTAPPVDNAANEALIRFLADWLGVAKSQVEIIAGHTARDKRIRVKGMEEVDMRRLLQRKAEKGNIR